MNRISKCIINNNSLRSLINSSTIIKTNFKQINKINYFTTTTTKTATTTTNNINTNTNDKFKKFEKFERINFNEIRENFSKEEGLQFYKSKVTSGSGARFYFEFIRKFKYQNQSDNAIVVYNDYKRAYPDNRDNYIATLVMSLYSSIGKMDECLEVYNNEILSENVFAYTVLICGYLDCSDFENAMVWLDRCLNEPSVQDQLDIVTFTSLISKLSQAGQYSIVDMVLAQIDDKNIKLDHVFYTGLIKSCSSFKGTGHEERLLGYFNRLLKDKNVVIDSKLFTAVIDSLYAKNMNQQVIEFYGTYKNDENVMKGAHNFFISIAYAWKSIKPTDINEIHQLWNRVTRPLASHYLGYFSLLNTLVEKEWATVEQCNLPTILENEINRLGSPTLFQTNISIVNQIIRWHLHRDDISTAWSIFQFSVSNSIADSTSFYHILSYFTSRSTDIIVYNNIKEILTSSYYLNLTKSYSSTYKKDIWVQVFYDLVNDPIKRPQLEKTIEIIKKFTHEDLNDYSKVLSSVYGGGGGNSNSDSSTNL